MTTAHWKNFYVSEYDQEMHIMPKAALDSGHKRKRTEIEYAPHAYKSILESAQSKIKDVETLASRLRQPQIALV